MQDQLVTFETAKLAKEKGFENSYISYDNWKYYINQDLHYLFWMTALQKWLREVHKIHIEIRRDEDEWKPELYEISHGNKHKPTGFKTYRTYEDALEIGLKEALKLIKAK